MLEELNLDNTEDKDYPEELTEYEWAWLHTTVPSPYDCQYCRHYKDIYGVRPRSSNIFLNLSFTSISLSPSIDIFY